MEIGRKKCIVMNCENHSNEGEFVGDLCFPCHEFVSSGCGIHSQAYRNAKHVEPRKMTFDLEFLHPNDPDSKELTCIFCNLTGCDRTFTLRGGLRGYGTTVSGLHVKCLNSHEAVVSSLKERNLL